MVTCCEGTFDAQNLAHSACCARTQEWTSTEDTACSTVTCTECSTGVSWASLKTTPNEYKNVYGKANPSPAACQVYCNMVEACIGFNFNKVQNECYFLAETTASVMILYEDFIRRTLLSRYTTSSFILHRPFVSNPCSFL